MRLVPARRNSGLGKIIAPSNAVLTFFMTFSIDIAICGEG